MIPIECPKCGRGGNVPLDRLNARLVCKGCQSAFHMDNSGRTVLGDPGVSGKKQPKARAAASEVDLAQTWNDIPRPVKYAVPAFVLALLAWQFNPMGGGSLPYVSQTEAMIRALASSDRTRALSFATTGTAGTAGKWYEMMRGQMDRRKIETNPAVSVSIFSGNPEKDTSVTLWCVASNRKDGSDASIPVNVVMNRDGGTWKLDGDRSLSEGGKPFLSESAPRKK